MDRKFVNQRIDEIKKIEIFNKDTFYKETLENIVDSNRKRPFKIVVVGEFSTGKSTFINAILGIDLLSHATEEITATITNIYNVPQKDKRYRTCDVTFINGEKIHLQDDSELIEYTTTQSVKRRVAFEIKSVDYYTNYMSDDTEVVIVDTPGLNGMADRHRELTLEEVKSADFCIYLFGIRGMADSDRSIIKQLEYYQKNYIFVLNFIDQLKISEGECLKERIDEISEMLEKEIFTAQKISYKVFGVSALKALAYKDKKIKKLYQDDSGKITSKERESYYNESGFGEFEKYLRSFVNSSTIEELCVDRMVYLLCNLLGDILDELKETQIQIENLRTEANTSSGIEKIQGRMKYFAELSEKNKKKVLDYAKYECIEMRNEFSQYVRNQLTDMKDRYQKNLENFKRYEELEKYITPGLNNQIKEDADKIYDYVEKNIFSCLNGILNNILIRIQEYLKDVRGGTGIQGLEFEIKKLSSARENQIKSMESDISETEQKKAAAQVKSEQAEKEEQKVLQEIDDYKNKLKKETRRQEEIRKMGKKTEGKKRTEYKTEYYTDYEYRGGFGILDALFGPKEVKRSRQIPYTVSDDSAKKKLEKEIDQIMQKSRDEIDRCKRNIKKSERQLKQRKKETEIAKNDLNYYKQKLAVDKETLEKLKTKANQELLNALKRKIMLQLEEFCSLPDGVIAQTVTEYIDETMEKNEKLICEKTEQYYDERVKSILEAYEKEIEGRKTDNRLKYGDYKEDIAKITKIRKELTNEE